MCRLSIRAHISRRANCIPRSCTPPLATPHDAHARAYWSRNSRGAKTHRSRAHPDHCRSYICLAAMSACVQPARSPRASSRLARAKTFLKFACARAWARATEPGVGWRSSCAPMDCRANGPASGLLADCRRPCSNCAIALLQGPACNEVVLRHKTATTRAGVRLTTSPPSSNANPFLLLSPGSATDSVRRKDVLPVVLHADHHPAVLLRLVIERLGEGADLGVGQASGRAVGVLTRGVVVQQQHHQPRAGSGVGPFQHFAVAGRVAECHGRPAADHEVNPLRLAGVVVVEQELRLLGQEWLAVLVVGIFRSARGADHLLRRDAIDLL